MKEYQTIRDTSPLSLKVLNDQLRLLWYRVKNITEKDIRPDSINENHYKDNSISGEKIKEASIDTAHIKDAAIDNAKIKDASITNAKIANAEITEAKIAEAAIGTAHIKDLAVTKAKIANAAIDEAKIADAAIGTAKIQDAAITSAKIQQAQIENAHIKHGAIEQAHIAEGAVGSLQVAEGAIGDAHISRMSADKLDAGTVNTTKVTIASGDNRFVISGRKLQIFDQIDTQLYERIMLGIDESNNSALVLRGSDGQTALLTQDGLTEAGFTDGYNKLEDNSLDPKKIDIQKVVTRINEGTTTINSSKILMDDKTLDIAFNTLVNTVSDQGEVIDSHTASITALDNEIKLKVDTQTFNQYKQTTDDNIDTITTNLSKATSDISVLQGQIELKVEQTDIERAIDEIEVGGRNYFRPSLVNNLAWASEGGIGYGVLRSDPNWRGFYIPVKPGEIYSLSRTEIINNRFQVYFTEEEPADEIPVLQKAYRNDTALKIEGIEVPEGANYLFVYLSNQADELPEIKLEKGNKATDWTPAPEDIDQAINTVDTKIDNKVSEINLSLDGITQRVSSVESSVSTIDDEVSSLETRVSSAEQKITPTAIVSTVRQSTAYQNDLDGKVSKNNIISEINQSAEEVQINANRLKIGTGTTFQQGEIYTWQKYVGKTWSQVISSL